MKPTFQCNDLRTEHIGSEVIVAGWVQRRRDHGGLIFIDLRDSSGIVQIVFNPEINPQAHKIAHQVRNEYVLAVKGKVNKRPEGTENPNLPTGEIEIPADEIEILNTSETPPFVIDDNADEVAEEIRLKYRYLDLRRPRMQNNLRLRHKVYMSTRKYLDEKGFIEVETPVLTKSTPEGARDFLVPSRLIPGTFFAMPQSPQLFKQLLMISGIGKYFQIVKCYRDEDLRADRQLEFTQIDIEMSFIDEEDIFSLTEGLMHSIFKDALGIDIPIPFPRMTYSSAMNRFGCDKPDVRFGMELIDVSDIVKDSDFKVFVSTVENGGQVKGIVAPGLAKASRKEIDDLTDYAKVFGAKGLVSMKVLDDDIESPVKKFFSQVHIQRLIERTSAKVGDLMLFVADKPQVVAESLNRLRLRLGNELGMIDDKRFEFLWIVDFPLFHYNEDEKRLDSEHHPFTGVHPEDMHLLETDPLKVRSRSYDLVLNGNEIASGSIRIHQMELQQKIFNILQLTQQDIEDRFGFFLEALKFGAPPHGGIAPGLDRLIAIMVGSKSIRDVIAFPKTQSGTCLVTGAPSAVSEKQLKELYIKTTLED
ncbi:MAG: aspartate--tRNA ligase [Candidatus Poribacteria bacterium]